MTTEEALIKISNVRYRQHQQPIGATRFELMQFTGYTLRQTLNDLNEMRDAGVVDVKVQKGNTVYYTFTRPIFYLKSENYEQQH